MKLNVQIKKRNAGITIVICLLLFPNLVEAQYAAARAVRRTAVVTTAVVVSAASSSDSKSQPAPAPAPAPAATAGGPLPIGAVVSKLPAGCASFAMNGQEYYHCGNDYYQSAYQSGTLVYVTTKAPQ